MDEVRTTSNIPCVLEHGTWQHFDISARNFNATWSIQLDVAQSTWSVALTYIVIHTELEIHPVSQASDHNESEFRKKLHMSLNEVRETLDVLSRNLTLIWTISQKYVFLVLRKHQLCFTQHPVPVSVVWCAGCSSFVVTRPHGGHRTSCMAGTDSAADFRQTPWILHWWVLLPDTCKARGGHHWFFPWGVLRRSSPGSYVKHKNLTVSGRWSCSERLERGRRPFDDCRQRRLHRTDTDPDHFQTSQSDAHAPQWNHRNIECAFKKPGFHLKEMCS